MKKTILSIAVALCAAFGLRAQEIPAFTKADIDTTSYLMGVNFGSFIKGYGFKDMNYDSIKSGYDDYLSAKGAPDDSTYSQQFAFNPEEVNDCFSAYLKAEEHTSEESVKASYFIGMNFGSFVKGYDFPALDYSRVKQGMLDFIASEKNPGEDGFDDSFVYSPSLMNSVFPRILDIQKQLRLEPLRAEQKAFFEENRKLKGVKETPSGLQYKIIKSGKAKLHPTDESNITVNYSGSLVDGTVFDSSEKPVTFPLSRMIEGWQEGLKLIGAGGHIILYVPSDLAYGDNGTGPIPPCAPLVFDITLVSVEE